MKKLLLLPLFLLAVGTVRGQDGDGDSTKAAVPATAAAAAPADEEMTNLKGKVDGLNESYLETKTTVDKLAKIKVSGYVQAQWQYADSIGELSFAGGNFPSQSATASGSRERFLLRRGRVKTTYEGTNNKVVLQIDIVPTGVSIKDAYGTITEPWLKTFSLTGGVFDRPFGFEISYSSSLREAPERTRMFQTLFPGERDLGFKLEAAPTENMGLLQYLNLKGGLFTGMGPTLNENDDNKDFIGRAGFLAPFLDLNLEVDGGFSTYLGHVTDVSNQALKIGNNNRFDTTTGNRLKDFDRNYFGVDGQIYFDVPVIGGLSLRGEYLWGTQPGTAGSSSFYAQTPAATPAAPNPAAPPVVEREFAGWYLAWIQNLGPKFQSVIRYDIYDPNSQVGGNDFAAPPNLTAADVAYATWGFGLLYHWDENTRFTAYYDLVTNEDVSAAAPASLNAYKSDIPDNVLTVRMQVKF